MSTTNNQETDTLIVTIDKYIQDKMRRTHLPGLAIGIIRHGKVIFLQGYGSAGAGRAVAPQTPFIIGSLSKSITALAIMQLVEQGLLDLDTSIQHYIPWFRVADKEASTRITVRHTLTHTSGLSRYAGRELLA